MSKKKQNLKREENAALAAKVEAYQKGFDEAFADIEATTDAAEKILKLRALDSQMASAISTVQREVKNTIDKRARRSKKTYFKRAGLVAVSLPIITLPFVLVVEPSGTSQKSIKDETRELKNEVDTDGFTQILRGRQRRIATMLDETVKNCDLRAIYKSPHFSDAVHSHEPLKKKFEAAAMAHAAGVVDQSEAATVEGTQQKAPAAGSRLRIR